MSKLRIRIEAADPLGSQAMSLLREAALEARRLYRRIDAGVPLRQFIDSNAPIPTNAPLPPRGAYFIAFLGNDLVGSGALRPLDETTVEVRRMYVIRSARRAGVGEALLAHLGRTAADSGFQGDAARKWESSASRGGIV
jgi:putative acetyltransferase